MGASHVPKLQAPRRKAGVRHKPYRLYNWDESLVTVRIVGTLPNFKFPDTSQGPTLEGGLFKDRRLGLLGSLFSTWHTPMVIGQIVFILKVLPIRPR